jgi:thiosulfate dehydrogenase
MTRRCRRLLGAFTVAVLGAGCSPKAPVAPPRYTPGVIRAPDGSLPPEGELGRSIRRGHALLVATRDSLPDHVGNALRCTSCHLDEGTRANAIPFTGVYARFPQYRSRVAAVQRIEDRVNDCFERSMNGTRLAFDDPAMRDIVSYFAFVSRGIAVGDTVPGQGIQLGKATSGDTVAGAAHFLKSCARCHAPDGNGTAVAPPLWGPRSFNIGAGMARIRTLTGFIHSNMPFDSAGTTSETDALNVAAYIASRARPDFPGKEHDWPKGDAPGDVAYPTSAGRKGGTP